MAQLHHQPALDGEPKIKGRSEFCPNHTQLLRA